MHINVAILGDENVSVTLTVCVLHLSLHNARLPGRIVRVARSRCTTPCSEYSRDSGIYYLRLMGHVCYKPEATGSMGTKQK